MFDGVASPDLRCGSVCARTDGDWDCARATYTTFPSCLFFLVRWLLSEATDCAETDRDVEAGGLETPLGFVARPVLIVGGYFLL